MARLFTASLLFPFALCAEAGAHVWRACLKNLTGRRQTTGLVIPFPSRSTGLRQNPPAERPDRNRLLHLNDSVAVEFKPRTGATQGVGKPTQGRGNPRRAQGTGN